MERVSEDAQAFLRMWADVGEVLDAATHEQLQLLRHYIEVIELKADDPKGKTGTYAMRLFPEACPDRGFDWSEEGIETVPLSPETTNGVDLNEGTDPDVFTESDLVRITDEKLPEVNSNQAHKPSEDSGQCNFVSAFLAVTCGILSKFAQAD